MHHYPVFTSTARPPTTNTPRSSSITSVSTKENQLTDGEKACSCYTFENHEGIDRFSWPHARKWCESNNKSLVVMETIEEWEFINSSLKDQIGNALKEWHIGLVINLTTGNWSWINGRPLTFDKWQPHKPGQSDLYVLIAKEFPTGSFGSFNSISRNPRRGWICEEQTDNCQGLCMHHYPVSTSTTRPPTTNTRRSSSITSVSTKENQLTDGEKACSCYTFENRERIDGFTWPQARNWCESNNKLLVVMETIEEWEFINSSLKDQIGNALNEWHIGLVINLTTGNWNWINGRPLTFDKWLPNEPHRSDLYVLIAKEYPAGFFGSFNGINRDPHRGWICEEQTDKCQGLCMHHYPVSTSTTRPPTTNTPRSSSVTSVSTKENQLTGWFKGSNACS
ncbi:PREDICTED: C-type mannose receptor 2-like [Acropora digitifera]|uniref:C-type mannose receptor 2-like n=1 Tax=Acropora digitifera TaxID=70779 RepID=UPI00077A52BB|nr:PREDICTED: C-type mannose receptor 2-like [Acropora digitifera]